MKHSAKLLASLILLFFVAGCSMFRTQQSGTLFSFNYEGKTYEIAGYTNSAGESANYLTYRENESVQFRAVDHNRSGIIDQIMWFNQHNGGKQDLSGRNPDCDGKRPV